MKGRALFHAVKRLLEQLQIGWGAEFGAGCLDPLALEGVFGRPIVFKENTEETRKGHICQSIRRNFVGDIVAGFVLRSSIPFLFLDQFEFTALAGVGWVEGTRVK